MEFDFQEDQINFDFLEEDLTQLDLQNQYDAVIFLVDAQAIPFINENIEESNLTIVANSFSSFLKNKIISNNFDKAGLVFYNTVNLKGAAGKSFRL